MSVPTVPHARKDAVVIGVYLALVICMWAWYGLHSGFGYETGFPLESESGTRGRHYGDHMRRFTTFFYHHPYVVGAKLGYAGSYVAHQLTYALLWLLRGVLVFQLVRMLGDRAGTVAFLAGAFTILHAADGSLNWVGQLNQFGFIFWMLLSFVALLTAFNHERRLWLAIPMAVVATQLARICIYSYESPLPLIFAFPLLALTLFMGWSQRKILLLAIYYSLPLQYCWRWVQSKLDRSIEDTYQFTVLREDWGVFSIFGDWIRNVWHSLAFWQWPRTIPEAIDREFVLVVALFSLAALAMLIAPLFWTYRSDRSTPENALRFELRLLTLGLAMVILSFPAYLLLDSATSHWRTQLLSGPGAGIALASLIALATRRLASPRAVWARAGFVAAITVAAVTASQGSALRHRGDWESHRTVVSTMLTTAPRVAGGTVVVLVNQRQEPLIFAHNLWWDYAVRLAYPNLEVTGILFDKPGQIAPGVDLYLGDSTLSIDSDAAVRITSAELSQLLVLQALPGNRISVARILPEWLGFPPGHRHLYRPDKRIGTWPPDPRAVRRFGPIERE